MKKQQRIQLFLFFAGVILIVLTYFYYPNLKKPEATEDDEITKELDENLEVLFLTTAIA